MILKPFDLNAAKDGKPVCTKDGRPARIICFDTKGDIYPIIALVDDNGLEVTIRYNEEGKSRNKDSDEDLMMAPEISESESMKQIPPRSWEEFCERYPIKKGESYIATSGNIYSVYYDCKERYSKSWCTSKKEAEAFLALMQLRQLRKAWIGDWEQPNSHFIIHVIKYDLNTNRVRVTGGNFWGSCILSFPTKHMAEDFLDCFKDLCETAKNLL